MIYCVVPGELADQLYDRLVDYYRHDPNVEVIVDRRTGPDRRRGEVDPPTERRSVRDRRRRGVAGTFPATDVPG